MAQIAIQNLTKIFGSLGSASDKSVEALRDINCDIPAGQFFCIIGPSGCGKTTLLHTIAGFTRPSGGRALLDGRPIEAPGPDRTVMFQEYGLFPWLTVTQNIEFGLHPKRLNAQEHGDLVRRYVKLAKLEGFENRYPHEISGGMKQRVSIARALAPDPQVVLMDEPFAALDSLSRDLLQEEILRIWDEARKTFILITHNIEEAVFLSDRVMVMTARPGRVKAIIDIDLPRPRDPAMRAHDTRFLALKEQLALLLRSEVAPEALAA